MLLPLIAIVGCIQFVWVFSIHAYFARSGLTYSGNGSDTVHLPENPVIPVNPSDPETSDTPAPNETNESDETGGSEETRESGTQETTETTGTKEPEGGETSDIQTGIPEIDDLRNDPNISGGIKVE